MILDKIKFKISFSNETLVDCNAAMKKPSSRQLLEISDI